MKVIDDMLTNRVGNYIVPGLDSCLLSNGKVRLFHSKRHKAGFVTPHNHRFDFSCLVLKGRVENRLYTEVEGADAALLADKYTVRTLRQAKGDDAGFGKYVNSYREDHTAWFTSATEEYVAGEWYSMTWDQFHSIEFTKDTKVLFFEGPEKNNESHVLLPFEDGVTLETMSVQHDWMFVEFWS